MTDDAYPLPTCAVCQRPVEHIERNYDPMRREFVFVVRCHGATEDTAIDDRFAASGGEIRAGVAFERHALAPVSAALPEARR